jgi:thiosulfate/3-mercaptopyruvate sulfurtransferase
MRIPMAAAAVTVVMALHGTPVAHAQTPALLVSPAWLAQHLTDRQLVILHVGPRAGYDAGHIPGARPIVEGDLAAPHDMARGDLMLEMPSPDALRSTLGALGVSDDATIVVYQGANTALQSATRIVLTLDYLGLGDRTVLLNGGLGAWQRAGHGTTAGATRVTPATLRARPVTPVVVDAAFVQGLASRPRHRLVDARAPVFYKGDEPTYGKRGHIPGAVSMPFTDIADLRGEIDRDRLATVFKAAGLVPGDTVVAYCHVGQQATAVIFAARLLGYPAVLYDGAFQDWATHDRGPTQP